MNYNELQKLSERLYFTARDVAELLKVQIQSARVLCTRNVKKGLFVRLKRNFYVLDQNWENFSRDERLKIANFLQVPSYLSFMTALSLHEVTTQVQRDFFESASLKRSVRFDTKGTVFNYYKIKKDYYFNFIKKDEVFIATPEKAFVDMIYLYSFGKYAVDFASLDMEKLDKGTINEITAVFPQKTKNIVRRVCRI
jgi:predicted transcriptional regulator of viral defense system